tara:strand:+ start:246 stop:440 length:195 start_codon:yes stop_codon:yes gene_type:complete
MTWRSEIKKELTDEQFDKLLDLWKMIKEPWDFLEDNSELHSIRELSDVSTYLNKAQSIVFDLTM